MMKYSFTMTIEATIGRGPYPYLKIMYSKFLVGFIFKNNRIR